MKLATVGLAGTLLVLSAALSGCSGEEDPPPVVVTPLSAAPTPVPVPQAATTSADTLAMQDSVDTADSEYAEEEYDEEVSPSSGYSPESEAKPKSNSKASSSPSSSGTASAAKSTSSDSNTTASNNNSTNTSTDVGGSMGGGYGGYGTTGTVMPGTATPTPAATPRSTLLAKAKTLDTHLLLSGLTAPNGSGQTLTYDAYFPTDYAKATTGPFVFVVHGGDWSEGAKEDVKSYAVALAQKGFVAIAPNYRLAPANPHPAQVNDLADVMKYIEANPDKLLTTGTKYGAVGVAAGGHLASLVALSPSSTGALKCVANVFSQSDLTNLPTLDAPIKQFLGTAYSPEKLLETSPVHQVARSAGAPSFFLSHGTADVKVPYAQSAAFAAALTGRGLTATLKPVEGAGHGYTDAQTSAAATDIATFMTSCLATR